MSYRKILERCRTIVSFFHSSTGVTATLTRLCENLFKNKMQQECATRWNCTLIMLRSLLQLKQPVTDRLRILRRDDLLLEEFDWDTITGEIDILSPFEEATVDHSSQFYLSLSKVIPCVQIIQAKSSGLISTEFSPWPINLLNDLKLNLGESFITLEREIKFVVSTFLDLSSTYYKMKYINI
jgi:hypothetical protein